MTISQTPKHYHNNHLLSALLCILVTFIHDVNNYVDPPRNKVFLFLSDNTIQGPDVPLFQLLDLYYEF